MPKSLNLRGFSRDTYSAKLAHRMAAIEAGQEEDEIPMWLEPPPHLGDPEAALWRAAVASRGVQWFKPADALVLEEYVLSVMEVKTARAMCHATRWDKDMDARLRRAQAQLLRYMRLLSITVQDRVRSAEHARSTRTPDQNPAMLLAEQAAHNAMDPLLQGFQAPPLSLVPTEPGKNAPRPDFGPSRAIGEGDGPDPDDQDEADD